jgi:hypothetical protein
MATYYINFDATYDGNGTAGTDAAGAGQTGAYNTLPTIASGNNYYIKRGNEYDPGTRLQLNGLNNITIGSYYLDDSDNEKIDGNTTLPMPTWSCYFTSTSTGDWSDLGGNVWELDAGTNYWNPHRLLGLGTLSSIWTEQQNYYDNADGVGGTLDTAGEWDYLDGDGSFTSKLGIYSSTNPVNNWTTIYYGKGQHPNIQIMNECSNIVIENINFTHGSNGVKINANSSNTIDNVVIQNCKFNHLFKGVQYDGTGGLVSNIVIKNNTFEDIGNVPIVLGNEWGEGILVSNNNIHRSGGCTSIGAIYGASYPHASYPNAKAYVQDNYADTIYKNTYWNESFGYYLESKSKNTIVRRNYIDNSVFGGLHTNSGEPGNEFLNNIVVNCGEGYTDSDALTSPEPSHTANTVVKNNIFSNVRIGAIFFRLESGDVHALNMTNNIFIADDSNDSQGIAYTTSANTGVGSDGNGGQWIEDYNCVYGFVYLKVLNGTSTPTTQTFGSNGITSNPKLNSDYTLQASSPCIGAGTTILNERDNDGRYRKSIGYDIGAKWFNTHEDSTINTLLASGGSI